MGDGEAKCCNEPQSAFLGLYVIYLAAAFVLHDSFIVKPMRLLATFVHEMSHAMATWCTGGEVSAIQVYQNEGGVTRYRGGCRCIIAPAGYLGEAFWGMVFVVLSGGRFTATVAASGLVLALLVSLCYSPNRTMVMLNLSYALVTGAVIFVEWYLFTPILTFIVLFYGVFLGAFALCDIFDHLVLRSTPGSDAYAMYEESARCCAPKCWGVQWLVFAIIFQILGFWIALILISDECEDLGWFECLLDSKFDLDYAGWKAWSWFD